MCYEVAILKICGAVDVAVIFFGYADDPESIRIVKKDEDRTRPGILYMGGYRIRARTSIMTRKGIEISATQRSQTSIHQMGIEGP